MEGQQDIFLQFRRLAHRCNELVCAIECDSCPLAQMVTSEDGRIDVSVCLFLNLFSEADNQDEFKTNPVEGAEQ